MKKISSIVALSVASTMLVGLVGCGTSTSSSKSSSSSASTASSDSGVVDYSKAEPLSIDCYSAQANYQGI